jgi:hypothetical protein
MSPGSRLSIDSPIYPLKRRVEAILLTGAEGPPAMPAQRESRLRGYRWSAPTHGCEASKAGSVPPWKTCRTAVLESL